MVYRELLYEKPKDYKSITEMTDKLVNGFYDFLSVSYFIINLSVQREWNIT